jgi:hypothetical protein
VTSFDRLSIVVSVTDPAVSGNDSAWLDALLREAASVDAELILAGAIADATSFQAAAREHAVELRILPAPPSSLTPQLWGLGLSASDRQIVAFTINQCVVATGWARAILDGFTHGDAGICGTLALAEGTSLTGRAIYFLRYSDFLGVRQRVRRQVRDIAGDNAAYSREVLARYGPYDHGFWEIEAHHCLRADGATLALVPGMEASFGGAPSFLPFIQQRFAHGRHFGAWRAGVGGRSSWKIMLGAPLVPFVLLVRTARKVAARPVNLIKLATCTVPFLLLAAAWAAGEASGARTASLTESSSA